MDRCSACNTSAPWCWLRSIGRCDGLSDPHWAAHNAARSPLGPPVVPPMQVEPVDPAEAARLRRAAKPRVPLGCSSCHGKVTEPPVLPPTEPPHDPPL